MRRAQQQEDAERNGTHNADDEGQAQTCSNDVPDELSDTPATDGYEDEDEQDDDDRDGHSTPRR